MRPVAEWLLLAVEDRTAHLTEWGASQGLRELAVGPHRSIDMQPPQSLNELIEVEHALSWGTDRVTELSYAVTSPRGTGKPPGYAQPS